MVGRVLLSVADGLLVSKPTVEVTTAAAKDLLFDSGCASFPIVEVIQYQVPLNWGVDNVVYFSNTYPQRPMVSVFYGGTADPTGIAVASQKWFALLHLTQVAVKTTVTYRNAASGNYTTLWMKLYTDRISFRSVKSNSGGSDMTAFSGYVTIIVHGFYS